MAHDLVRTVHRYHLILANLLDQLPPVDRERYLVQHADDLQDLIDEVLSAIGVAPSAALVTPTAPAKPTAPVAAPVAAPEPHVHTPACEHVHQAVERADMATVPGVIRAVLANETGGLLPRQVIEGVRLLRPETDESSVHGALHQMRRRGELAREGFHKNYRYRLVPLTSLGAGIVQLNTLGQGGETH